MKALGLFLFFAIAGFGEESPAALNVETIDPLKKEITVLEKALENDPDNPLFVYDLGHAYTRDVNQEKALEMFTKRISMGGSEDEIYHSLYMIGMIEESLDLPQERVTNSYCKAFAYRSYRAEPIFRLASYLNRKQNFTLGYALIKLAVSIPMPAGAANLEVWVYEYGALAELAHASFWLGKMEESKVAYEKLLTKNLPLPIKESFAKNLEQVLLCCQERNSGPKK